MGVIEQAWREAGEHFARLGHELRASYDRQAASEEGTKAGAGAGAADQAGDRQAVEDGLRRLADALDHLATTAGAAIRDPGVGKAARLAADSLGVAITATLDEFSQELRGRHGQRPDGGRPDGDQDVGRTGPPPAAGSRMSSP